MAPAYTNLTSEEHLPGSCFTDRASCSSSTVCESVLGSVMEPSIGTALAHSTDGIPFKVLVSTLMNFSFDGDIPRTSVKGQLINWLGLW